MHHHALINTLKASQNWINQFNHGNLNYCASAFAENAALEVSPMGQFTTPDQIRKFWMGMLQSGANNLTYSHTRITLINDDHVQLRGQWQMNIARGNIVDEHWRHQPDGHWKLAFMKLEITEQF